jgi:type II secretory pathway pseudopilin PulG
MRAYAFTLIEALVSLVILTVILMAGWSLFVGANNAYQDIVWQNRVNQEARQALDDMCDMVRLSGSNQDLLSQPLLPAEAQFLSTPGISTLGTLECPIAGGGGYVTYTVQQRNPPAGDDFLTRQITKKVNAPPTEAVAQYLVTVNFEYEYRVSVPFDPLQQNSGSWTTMRRTELGNQDGSSGNPICPVNVVYIQVTAQVTPFPGGLPYTRTLRSAVHPRCLYNLTVPGSIPIGSYLN